MTTRIENNPGSLFPVLPLLLAGMLAACSGNELEADVTRFHLGPMLEMTGKRVTIKPARPELEGLEFSGHAARVGDALGEHGFTPAGEGEADIVALLDYSVAQIEVERDSPFRIGLGGGGFGRNVGGGAGLSFPVGGGTSTVWVRRIDLVLTDAVSGVRLWEGRAVSEGKVEDLGFVLPLLAEALLADFPGESGRTVRVEIDPERKPEPEEETTS